MVKEHEWTFFQRRQTSGQQVYEKILTITNHSGNKKQNHNEIAPHLLGQLSSKHLEITNVGKDAEKRKPLPNADGNVNWHSHYGKHYKDSSNN